MQTRQQQPLEMPFLAPPQQMQHSHLLKFECTRFAILHRDEGKGFRPYIAQVWSLLTISTCMHSEVVAYERRQRRYYANDLTHECAHDHT